MRARHVLSIAFGVFMTASFLKPCETYGFMMGGSGQGKDCEIFIPATKTMLPNGEELPDNYDVALTNENGETEWVPFMVMFNQDCHKVKDMPHALYHINNETNLFFLRQHGDMVIYSTVYQGYDKLQRTTSAGDLYNNKVKNEAGKINRFGRLFITYSVPKNDTSCGYKASNNNPICEKDKTYYDWGHALDSYTKANIEKLTEAMNEGNKKTIEALTGEFEYIGYSTDGTPINNPYFPSEYPVRYKNGKVVKEGTGGSGEPGAYPWIENPWAWGTPKTKYDDSLYGEAYAIKKEAIARLMEQEESMSGKTVNYWMKRLSLKNNADTQSAVFEGREDGKPFYDSQSGTWKQLYNLVLLEAPETALKNVGIMKMTIYDGEEKIASFTRDVIGYEQGSAYMKKENGKAVVLEGGKEYNLVIKVMKSSRKTTSISYKFDGIGATKDGSLKEIITVTKDCTSMWKEASQELTIKVKMPDPNTMLNIDLWLEETT